MPAARPEWQPSEDEVWAEHQAYERHHRSPLPLDHLAREAERRERVGREVARALQVVLADFRRWRE